jgi:hypothetical protein
VTGLAIMFLSSQAQYLLVDAAVERLEEMLRPQLQLDVLGEPVVDHQSAEQGRLRLHIVGQGLGVGGGRDVVDGLELGHDDSLDHPATGSSQQPCGTHVDRLRRPVRRIILTNVRTHERGRRRLLGLGGRRGPCLPLDGGGWWGWTRTRHCVSESAPSPTATPTQPSPIEGEGLWSRPAAGFRLASLCCTR